MSTGPTVLVADDHAPIRVGVTDVLTAAGCRVVAEVASSDAAVEAAGRTHPDVCLIDVDMPGNGIEAVGRILAVAPDTHILMLTVSDTYEDLVDALREGASGYLLKDIAPAQLVDEVLAAAEGRVALSRDAAALLVQGVRHGLSGRPGLTSSDGRHVDLTPREWDVLQLLGEGLPTRDIGRRLFLRPPTVRRHISEVTHKLRVASRHEAVQLYRNQTIPAQRRGGS